MLTLDCKRTMRTQRELLYAPLRERIQSLPGFAFAEGGNCALFTWTSTPQLICPETIPMGSPTTCCSRTFVGIPCITVLANCKAPMTCHTHNYKDGQPKRSELIATPSANTSVRHIVDCAGTFHNLSPQELVFAWGKQRSLPTREKINTTACPSHAK